MFDWETVATYASKAQCELARRDRLFYIAKAAEQEEREAAAFTRQQTYDLEKSQLPIFPNADGPFQRAGGPARGFVQVYFQQRAALGKVAVDVGGGACL